MTGDEYDKPIENSMMNVALAYNGETDDLVTHGTKTRTVVTINFFTGENGVHNLFDLPNF